MASTTSSRSAALLLLLALFHSSSCWDASNIWFPDPNNPVFYNMTFYQQAGPGIDTEPPSENLLPATEPPRKNNRPRPSVSNPVKEAPVRPADFEAQRPRPNVFNPVQQAPVQSADFEAQRPRPNVFNPVQEATVRPTDFEAQRPRPNAFNPVQQAPVRPTDFDVQRPRPNVFNPVQQAPVRPTDFEAQRPRPNVFNPSNQVPVRRPEFEPQRPNVFNPTVVEAPVRPTETYASVVRRRTTTTTTTTKQPNRNRQPNKNPSRVQQSVKGGSQSGNPRITEQQQQPQQQQQQQQRQRQQQQQQQQQQLQLQQFNRNQQDRQPIRNPEPTPDILVGYKTLPYTEATPTNRRDQQPSRNRLRRTQVEGVADGRNYFNNNEHERTARQYPEQQRWTGNSDAFLSGSRPEERLEATNNGIGSERNFGRPVVPVQGDRRNWNTGTSDNDRLNPVEENVITELETSSKATGPSRCVWAIISCCKPTSSEIRYTCFETLGCHGAFWDTNPCSRDMTLAAVHATANFYNVPRTEEEEED